MSVSMCAFGCRSMLPKINTLICDHQFVFDERLHSKEGTKDLIKQYIASYA